MAANVWREDCFHSLSDVADIALRYVREQRRPGLLVIDTKRIGPHSEGDDSGTEAELDLIRAHDPVTRLGLALTPARRAAISEAAAFLVDALPAARVSPEARSGQPPRSIFASVATTSPPTVC